MLNLANEIAQEVAKRKEVPAVARIVKRLLPLAIKDLRRLPEEKMIQGIQMLIVALGRVLYPESESMHVQLREPMSLPASSNGETE